MVMEDAAVLSGLLPLGTKVSEVNERMRAYQNLRKDRTEFVAKESMEQCIYPFKRGFYTNSASSAGFSLSNLLTSLGRS
jgi:salicylate hydroxylase